MKHLTHLLFLIFILNTTIVKSQNNCTPSGAICMCPMIYNPVCGCDGVMYSNSCLANCQGVTYASPLPDPNGGGFLPCVAGCTDPNALNYNPSAAVSNNSCLYGSTPNFVSTIPENKNVVLEHFQGGIYNYWGPAGDLIAQQLASSNPNDVFVITIHEGSFAQPNNPNHPNLTAPLAGAIQNQACAIGYPTGSINRHYFPGLGYCSNSNSTAMSRSDWTNATNQILAQSSYVNVAAQATIDGDSRLLTVDVEAYYTASSTVPTNKLNVVLIQNNIEDSIQSGKNNNTTAVLPNGNYNHQKMYRHLLTGQWGDDITSTTQGSLFQNTYTYTIPNDLNGILYDLTNLEVVVFVAENNQEIINGNMASMTVIGTNGCTDPTAFNYDPIAVIDDSSCMYCNTLPQFITNTFFSNSPSSLSACDGFLLSNIVSSYPIVSYNWINSQGSSVGNSNYVSSLCNDAYILTVIDSVGCSITDTTILGVIMGCTDTAALNYNWIANYNDGSCIPIIYGCIDPLALNFDSTAHIDDGSCCYIGQNCAGCIDSLAYNYNPNALVDDGSCLYCDLSFSLLVSNNSSPNSCDGFAIANVTQTSNLPVSFLWSNGSTQNNITGLCAGTYSITLTDGVGCISDSTFTIPIVPGCKDSTAYNYNPNATIDDGSCFYGNGCNTLYSSPGWYPNSTINLDTSYVNQLYSDTLTIFIPLDTNVNVAGLNLNNIMIDSFIINSISGLPQNFIYNCSPTNCQITGNESICIYIYSSQLPNINDVGFYPLIIDYTMICNNVPLIGMSYENGINQDYSISIVDPQIYGCTNPLATNYNPLATIDDSSCVYATPCTKPTPNGLNATEITHNRAKVNWVDANSSNCMVEMYRVQYREQGTTTWSQKTALGSGLCIYGLTTTSKTLWNLSPSTTYEYRAKAWYCNTTGASSWSPIATFTTLDVCPNVDNFTVSTPTNTRATFSWTAPSSPYSFVRIKLRVDTSGATWLTAGGYGVMYPALTRNKNGLTPGQNYLASSRTWCDPNGGPYKATSWTPFIYWTQPGTLIRIESEDSRINNLTIYPNPSRDIFNITFQAEEKQDLKVRLLNVIGEELMVEDLQQFIGQYTKGIDLSNNAKGIYFLEIETNYGVINKKLILQ